MPPSALTEGRWLAEDASVPKRWRIGTTTAVTLLTGLRGQERTALVDAVRTRTGLGRDAVERLVDDLVASGLLTRTDADGGSDRTRQTRFDAIRRRWRRFNWTEAVEYHAGTLDYPFLDYAAGGRQLDNYRMRGYVEAEPDTDRHKQYPSAPRIPLPAPAADLAPGGVAEALAARPARSPDAAALSALLSLTFGQIDRIDHGRWQRSPMMRRTSPSGGARHPCEGYAIVLDVPGVPPGAYHVDPAGPTLQRIRPDAPEPATLAAIVPIEFHRFDHEIAAVIVVTCVFARNMYRYREPRTFRTVHNDAGHLAATAAMAAAATGLRCQVEYAGDDRAIESYLGLDGLTEGFMLTLSLLSPEPTATARTRRVESLGAGRPQLTRTVDR
jgi:SagB-type dehydrogenase family enzyme